MVCESNSWCELPIFKYSGELNVYTTFQRAKRRIFFWNDIILSNSVLSSIKLNTMIEGMIDFVLNKIRIIKWSILLFLGQIN